MTETEPTPPPIALRAGALTMRYEQGDLRYICLGDHEILRRIYVAVRDPNWVTIPARLTLHELSVQPDSFTIRYRAEHQQGVISFIWEASIVGSADSSLTFTMDGEALSTFLKNRIGFCVLHPMSLAGAPCVVEHTDGTQTNGVFPVDIMPHQPFMDMRAITHQAAPAVQAEVRFSGDIFEMEDQRNWTDASYKTYGTPHDIPFPVEIAAGTRVRQSVALRFVGDVPSVAPPADLTPHLTIAPETMVGWLPRLGLASAGDGQPLSPTVIDRLRLLHLAHLRAEVHFDQADWQQRLRQNADEARQLSVPLEMALFLTNDPDAELAALRRLLYKVQAPVATWLIFSSGHVSTPPGLVEIARRHLESYAPAPFAGGTDAFFVQLNRSRPPLAGLDLLTYSINPQLHAFDNASLVETLPAQAVTLESARRLGGSRGVMISPVTLRYRYNPASTRREPLPLPGETPRQVDPRQKTPFGAGWTLGSIKYLGEGRAKSVTYYETIGDLGVMDAGGEVFPLYHALADVGEWAGAEITRATSSQPLTVDLLALRRGTALRVLVANFSDAPQPVILRGLVGAATLRTLDTRNAAQAIGDPQGFRANPGEAFTISDGFRLELAPFAIARLDFPNPTGA